jgi:hypothetical protein
MQSLYKERPVNGSKSEHSMFIVLHVVSDIAMHRTGLRRPSFRLDHWALILSYVAFKTFS